MEQLWTVTDGAPASALLLAAMALASAIVVSTDSQALARAWQRPAG